MNLVRYNKTIPKRSSHTFGDSFDDLFFNPFSAVFGGHNTSNTPSINIIEEKDRFLVEVASPGFDKADFDVKIENDQLIISASRENTAEETENAYTRKEFNYSAFTRSFYLPETVDGNKTDAHYKNGILTIELSKKEESIAVGPKEIAIK